MSPGQSSIRGRMKMLGLASASLAILLTSLGFVWHDLVIMRQSKVQQLDGLAAVLAAHSAPALATGDALTVRRSLELFRQSSQIDSAEIRDLRGEIVAFYGESLAPLAEGNTAADSSSANIATGEFLDSSQWTTIELVLPIQQYSQPIGTLILRTQFTDLRVQLQQYAQIVAVVIGMSLLVAMLASIGLANRISRPIQSLATIARTISVNSDFSLRAAERSYREVSELARAFNAMMACIERQKASLREAKNSLEKRVSERTLELSNEVATHAGTARALIAAKEAAEAANRAKSEFLANMSHEIRTPLNAILGFSDLLLRGAAQDEREERDFLETVHSSGANLLDLINDILDLSKIEAGQLDLEQIVCPLQPLISEVLTMIRPRAEQKGLWIRQVWKSEAPETVVTDPARFRQLLVNLVSNAVKFTEHGGALLECRLQAGPENAALLVIDVIDTGIGIPADKLEAIFDPFVQADTSVTRRFGGTGLGLAICRKLAMALGGSIEVQSNVGKGSRFRLTIACGCLDEMELLPPAASETLVSDIRENAAVNVNLTGARVLLAEDGETNRRLIALALRRAGAQVVEVEHGAAAVELARHEPFDLILMDMQMPVLDGYAATRALRDEGFVEPIVALTAHAMKGDEERCREAGCSGYLTKPIALDTLLHAVQQALSPEYCNAHPEPTISTPTPSNGARPAEHPLLTWRAAPLHNEPLRSHLPTEDPDFREIVVEFVKQLDLFDEALHAAAEEHDLEQLACLAHRLKGTGGTAGFPCFTEPARRLEDSLRDGEEDVNAIAAMVEELRQLAQRVRCDNGDFSRTGLGLGPADSADQANFTR